MRPTAIKVGDRFGRLTVQAITERWDEKRRRLFIFLCDCGTQIETHSKNIQKGTTRSCGCLKRESAAEMGRLNAPKAHKALTTHGCSRTRARESGFTCWSAMWERCANPNYHHFADYGGRGITVCEQWKDFSRFLQDVGPRPSLKHTLDRYPNNDGNYEPGNVRWALPKEQANNRRVAKPRTLRNHCERGHELAGDNVMARKGTRGRACRECKRLHSANNNKKRQALARATGLTIKQVAAIGIRNLQAH